MIQKSSYISLTHIADSSLYDGPSQLVHAHVRAALGAIPIAAVFEVLLVDLLQNLFYRLLNYLIFQTADSQRPSLFTARLRYIAPATEIWTIPHTLQSVRQVLELLFKVLSVLLLGYAVHTHGLVGFECFVAVP